MKLFIWEGNGVLTDWTNGLIVVLAKDLKSALKAIEKDHAYCMNSFPHIPSRTIDLGDCKRKTPVVALQYGGG